MRPRIVAPFSLIVALVLAGVVIVVGREFSEGIRQEALNGAEQTVEVFAHVALEKDEYEEGRVTPQAIRDLRDRVASATSILGVRLWSPDYRIEYADAHSRVGASEPTQAMRAAFAGKVTSEVAHHERTRHSHPAGTVGHTDREVRVYVPITLAEDARPVGVLAADLPYEPVQTEIDHHTRRIFLILGVAAVLLYAALLPIMLRVSHMLTRIYEQRYIRLQRGLRQAIERAQLLLHYQPKVSLIDGSLTGVEALLRWRHPDRGIVPPGDYLPQVETTPLMGPLTLHVFELAARQAASWRNVGLATNIAVNLSLTNLTDRELPRKLAEILDAQGLPPGSFTLEVTETAAMVSTADVDDVLADLRRMGFRLSIDDFGTGYSSLRRLDQLPIDELKIDRAFTSDVGRGDHDTVVSAVIGLAKKLGMTTVAEGVETQDTAERLAELGCAIAQGFHYSKPLPPDELLGWLEYQRAA